MFILPRLHFIHEEINPKLFRTSTLQFSDAAWEYDKDLCILLLIPIRTCCYARYTVFQDRSWSEQNTNSTHKKAWDEFGHAMTVVGLVMWCSAGGPEMAVYQLATIPYTHNPIALFPVERHARSHYIRAMVGWMHRLPSAISAIGNMPKAQAGDETTSRY